MLKVELKFSIVPSFHLPNLVLFLDDSSGISYSVPCHLFLTSGLKKKNTTVV